jgi:hypothetical protein
MLSRARCLGFEFSSQDEAMAYAQRAYESLLRANDDFQMMAMAS